MTLTREILHIINGLLTVEELTFLYDRYCKTDWETVYIFKPIIIGKLIKAGYLDAEHNVTEKGGTLIEKLFGALQMNAGYKKPDKASLNKDDPFKQFWITYPRTNKYLHFPATKVLRANEKKVRTLYVQLIKEGKVTHDDLMFALQAEIKAKGEESIRKKVNQFTFFKGIYSWLFSGYYDAWLELRESEAPAVADTDFYNQGIS